MCVSLYPCILIFNSFPIYVKHVNFELACEKQKQRHNRTVARIGFTIDTDPLYSPPVSPRFPLVSIHAATTTLESLWPNTKSRGRCLAHICVLWHICISVGPLRNPPFGLLTLLSTLPINATKSSTQKPKVFFFIQSGFTIGLVWFLAPLLLLVCCTCC